MEDQPGRNLINKTKENAYIRAVRYGGFTYIRREIPGDKVLDTTDIQELFLPLDIALSEGRDLIASWIIDRGYPSEFRTDEGITLFHLAVLKGNICSVNSFLHRNADVNVRSRDRRGMTPLHDAARYGHDRIVYLLIKHGADVEAISWKPEYSALEWAAIYGQLKCLELLIKAERCPTRYDIGDHYVHLAARNGCKNIIEYFLGKGGFIDITNWKKRTPLHEGAARGHLGIVDMLIDRGADVNALSGTGKTPLHYAASNGHYYVCVTLLNRSAKQLLRFGKPGSLPVFSTLKRDQVKCFEKLYIDAGYEGMNMRGENGLSLMQAAVLAGAENIFLYLLKVSNYLIDEKTTEGRTLLHLAAGVGNSCMLKELLKSGLIVNQPGGPLMMTPLHEAVAADRHNVVSFMVNSGARAEVPTSTGLTAQHTAAEHGCVKSLEQLFLKLELNLQQKDLSTEQNTPLHLAARGGHVETAMWLLKNKVPVDILNGQEFTPLHLGTGSDEIVYLLLRNKAYVNTGAHFESRITPLHFAAKNGSVEVVKLLIRWGGDQFVYCSKNQEAPIHWAARYNNIGSIFAMETLDFDLRLQTANVQGYRPLHVAAMTGKWETLCFFLNRGIYVDTKTNHGVTSLHLGVFHASYDVVCYLLSNNADMNSRSTQQGFTPLHVAVVGKSEPILSMLLRRKADLTIETNRGETPMHWAIPDDNTRYLSMLTEAAGPIWHLIGPSLLMKAIFHNAEQSVQYLIDKGVPLEVVNEFGFTPVLFAAVMGRVDILQTLWDSGADINLQYAPEFNTPLHYALRLGKIEAAEFLLQCNVDLNKQNSEGMKPLHTAVHCGHLRFCQMLSYRNCDVFEPLNKIEKTTSIHLAAFAGQLDVVQWLVDAMKVPVDTRTASNATPLHVALLGGFKSIVWFLVLKGADVDAIFEENLCTALHCAAELGTVDLAIVLIIHGANIDARTRDFKTPLHVASQNGDIKMVKMLTEYYADISLCDSDGMSAENLALKYGHKNVADFLHLLTDMGVIQT